jgi:hypothetical protein
MSFADPWEDIFEERNADSFVDDTSNRCNDGLQEEAMPYTELIAKAQVMAQIWERILYSLGGALELRKCFWYLLYWTWENGHPQLATKIECPGIIALTSGHVPNYTVIPRLEVWRPVRLLESAHLRMEIIEKRGRISAQQGKSICCMTVNFPSE